MTAEMLGMGARWMRKTAALGVLALTLGHCASGDQEELAPPVDINGAPTGPAGSPAAGPTPGSPAPGGAAPTTGTPSSPQGTPNGVGAPAPGPGVAGNMAMPPGNGGTAPPMVGDMPIAGMTEPGAPAAPGGEVGGPIPPPPYSLPEFVNLAPPMGAPLDMMGTQLSIAPPAGWTWYQIDGAVCRDGSPTGFYVHWGTADKLLFYLEGGGACSNVGFCNFNPSNTDQVLAGDGQTVLNSALGAIPGRQQPGAYTGGVVSGIFDTNKADNPFKDWHQIYVPYCTGDVHFGTRANGTVPGLAAPQQFVGYENMKKFVSRIVPTFADLVDQVVLTGASAGGFGAALNYSMVQDAFGDSAYVVVLDDSGAPFDDQYMPVCMQKRWRESWGFEGSMPPDCTECMQADGGGLARLADYMLRKHPHGRIAMISSMEDEIIRLFYSVGLVDCANYDTADPVAITLLQADPSVYFPAQQYSGGLNTLRSQYMDSGHFATYFMSGVNLTMHQHTFRPRFYEAAAGGTTIANFVQQFLAGELLHVGP